MGRIALSRVLALVSVSASPQLGCCAGWTRLVAVIASRLGYVGAPINTRPVSVVNQQLATYPFGSIYCFSGRILTASVVELTCDFSEFSKERGSCILLHPCTTASTRCRCSSVKFKHTNEQNQMIVLCRVQKKQTSTFVYLSISTRLR